jgi:hypothetical protein
MAEFASRQKAFMEQAMDTEDGMFDSERSTQAEAGSIAAQEKSYDCVICGQANPSTEERPIGLVALAQSTSGELVIVEIYSIQVGSCVHDHRVEQTTVIVCTHFLQN